MIWAFFTRRLRLWLIMALGVPILRWVLRGVGDKLEHRGGETVFTRGIRAGNEQLERFDRRARRESRRGRRSKAGR